MRILSIDSSLGTQLLLCDAEPDAPADGAARALRILSAQAQEDSRRHAESLGPMLAAALAAPDDGAPLDVVVVATGPAPFTGLRAGLVTARALARARRIPACGVPSLDAVARRALDELTAEQGREAADAATVLVATDARRKEVYCAAYRARGADDVEPLAAPAVTTPLAAAERLAGLGSAAVAAGSGCVLYPEIADGRPVLAPASGSAGAQARIALARLARGEELGTEPLYLRLADAQVPTGRKRALAG
ncbi:tRNA (adenosine(37)-N6)-threonylcarbamoyltransferase complex dimerization subunit type 1 TsaB [Actinomyces marmotae]|uniref:tRNA (Adenosine(37)-N6)-threonylcarbamoyltransferase complex dimerization subunit type 1 TsaB n=1 Tax=Actinomyces marmotae TaxID=2737173 RepID=A0A6M8AYL9_9ACTO|nr:tRNA (adenosine(37)-N6)-threonylcarbamoyltransferase complex dimerization subunit type 1 TsaB [Actinomyces marmotae]QKD79294.1 tRNA (adenosine(37)-N6)-threonylcarbamoyltransferase complex dimerization subunit type 1 TsaB [Actinomyces marmotae]